MYIHTHVYTTYCTLTVGLQVLHMGHFSGGVGYTLTTLRLLVLGPPGAIQC